MKVAFDSLAFTTQRFGGVSRYVVLLAEALRRNPEVDSRIFGKFHINEYLSEAESGLAPRLLRIQNFLPKTRRLVHMMNDFISEREMKRWRPDVFHESYFGRRALRLPQSCLRVCTVHDMIHEIYPDLFAKNDRTTQLKKAAVDRADHVICISENTKQDLISYFDTPEEKISVVYHGTNFLPSPASSPPDKYFSRPYLLFVGQRGHYKNFIKLVQAVAESDELKKNFDIVAFGGGAFTREELQKFEHMGFNKSQIRQMSGNDQRLANLYAGAAVFCYPSSYEGFGMPPLEAMARDCPVACSNVSCIPEIVGDAAELFDPENTDSISKALLRIVVSKERGAELVERGKRRAASFTWQRCSEETAFAYRKAGTNSQAV